MKNNVLMKLTMVKKMPEAVDNPLIFHTKRYQLILQVQAFLSEGCSFREIAKRLGISRNTVSKYKTGDPVVLCEYGIKQSKLDGYRDHIVSCLKSGDSKSKTIKSLFGLGYDGSMTNAFDYLKKIELAIGLEFEPQPYVRTYTESLKYKTGSIGKENDFITRNGVFRYLWMKGELTDDHRRYIFETYPILYKIQLCIREFRTIFELKNVPKLYLFIENYKNIEINELKSFANGLSRDVDAVENAVAYDLSNGFVEGTNSKLKMIKRTMYGKCRLPLLTAKMVLVK